MTCHQRDHRNAAGENDQTMNHLLVICHPRPGSFVRAVGMVCAEVLEEAGHEVRVRDLYDAGFDPVLSADDLQAIENGEVPPDVRAEQQHVQWADAITMIHPLWLNGLPAMLKGYLDRVFSYGFAYGLDEDGSDVGLLGGRSVALITTTGALESESVRRGVKPAMDHVLRDNFVYCGLEDVGHLYLWGVSQVGDDDRRRMLDRAMEFVTSI